MNRPLKLTLIALLTLGLSLTATAQMSTTAGGFTLRLISVQYDWDAPSSAWTYGLTWDGSPPELSHLTIDLCDTAKVLDFSPTDLPVVTSDGSVTDPDNLVIKWDDVPSDYLTPGVEKIFSFTLDNTYAVESVTFWPKAGQADNVGSIFGPSCEIADPDIDVSKTCPGDVFVGDSIDYVITVTNTGNVPLASVAVDDNLAGIHQIFASLAPGESHSIPASVPATSVGDVVNTVTAGGDYFGNVVNDDSSCTTTVWALEVGKTATTSYTRAWDWTLEKSVEEESVDICGQSSATLHYTVTAARTSSDSNHNVSGTITVHNPAPIAAPIAAVSDQFEGYSVTVACGVSFPFDLPAGGYLTCTYSLDLGQATDGTNVAAATLANQTSFGGSASVIFGEPTTEIDPVVTIEDSLVCPVAFTCSATPFPMSIGGDATIPFDVEVTKAGAECNSYFTVSNTATMVESDALHSSSVSTEIYTCQCGFGCTLTIGYWKTHAGFTGRNDDNVTQYLPIWLGDPYGTFSHQITTAEEAVEALSMGLGQPSNGITKLYAQLLGAKLNMANGSSSGDVSNEMVAADRFLATHGWEDWNSLSKKDKKDVLSWMSTFDAYNNGDIGPGHCD